MPARSPLTFVRLLAAGLGLTVGFAAVSACSDTPSSASTVVDASAGGGNFGDILGSFGDAADGAAADGSTGTDGGSSDGSADANGTAAVCTTPNGPWCPCKENADCDTGFCAETSTGHVCAAKCVDACPDGFSCAGVNIGGADLATICVPRWGWLCDPCNTNSDCDSPGVGKQAACMDYGAVGRFCGFDCATTADCPSGYVCGEGKTVDGATRKQCWHGKATGGAASECACSPRASALELVTGCWVVDGATGAKCTGSRHCKAGGLEACSATPGQEVCNGKDDDCNGKIDDLACDDQNACTQDVCDPGSGKCANNPLDGSPCDADNTGCTQNDACQKGVCTPGAPKTCSDGNPCTDDACDPQSGCTYANNSAGCDDGKACTTGDSCTGGACTAGKSNGCDDANSCTDQACDAKSGNCTTTFNTLACDDGNPCSSSDACQAGVCKAGATVDCSDTDPCTVDSCESAGKGCKHTTSTGVCDDGDACTFGETCASGGCNGGKLIDCNDLNPCTADSCNKTSGCVHAAKNGACNDGNACTENDACAGGACGGQAIAPCPNDNQPCTDDVCDPTKGCQHVNNTLACTDGNVCTQNDTCAGGVCVGGALKTCASDGNPCTTESCDALSDCHSSFNSAGCDDGDPCTVNDTCSGGSCQTGTAKNCSAFSSECGTGLCKAGACYTQPAAIASKCSLGVCDGAGTCVAQPTYTVDGCTKEPTVDYFVSCKVWGCYGCNLENGFSAYNITDCATTGCFDRFPTFGVNGYIVMWADWEQSAWVKWQFAKPLIGNYKIEAVIPQGIPANAGSCTPAQATYATGAVYHLETAGGELATKTVNHSTAKKTTVTLFQGDATGLVDIKLYNGPATKQPPACEFYLVDAVYATPY